MQKRGVPSDLVTRHTGLLHGLQLSNDSMLAHLGYCVLGDSSLMRWYSPGRLLYWSCISGINRVRNHCSSTQVIRVATEELLIFLQDVAQLFLLAGAHVSGSYCFLDPVWFTA